jgi:Aromatic prenyltransferase Orf2
MSHKTSMEVAYAAIEESARLLDVPCSREKVLPVMTAFGDGIAEEAMMVLAMAGGERHRGEIDYNFTVPTAGQDPYSLALSHRLIAPTDHPVASLLHDVSQRCAVSFYGVECGVVAGFKKTYVFFPLDELQSLSKLADIPSMPPALADHIATFSRHGLDDRVSIIGIDYIRNTMNVYFAAETVDAHTAVSVLRDSGLPEPSAPMLEFIQKSFSIYPTFSWDTQAIGRICFSVVTPDQNAYPTSTAPEIARFAKSAPYSYSGDRVLVYGATVTPREEYHKLGVYYQKPPGFWNKLQLGNEFDKLTDAR